MLPLLWKDLYVNNTDHKLDEVRDAFTAFFNTIDTMIGDGIHCRNILAAAIILVETLADELGGPALVADAMELLRAA